MWKHQNSLNVLHVVFCMQYNLQTTVLCCNSLSYIITVFYTTAWYRTTLNCNLSHISISYTSAENDNVNKTTSHKIKIIRYLHMPLVHYVVS